MARKRGKKERESLFWREVAVKTEACGRVGFSLWNLRGNNTTMSPVAFVESPVLLLFFPLKGQSGSGAHGKKKTKKLFPEQKVKYDWTLRLVSGRFSTLRPRSGFRAVTRVVMDETKAVVLTSPSQIVHQVLLAAGDLSKSAALADPWTLLDWKCLADDWMKHLSTLLISFHHNSWI